MKTCKFFLGILASCVFIIFCLTLVSCGKKSPPVLKGYEKPEVPVELKAMHRENSIMLSWSHSNKESLKEFIVIRANVSGFTRLIPVPKEETFYSDTDFKTENIYRYRVIAKSVKGVLSDDSQSIEIKPLAVPSAPKNLSFHIGNRDLKISWDEAGKGLFYNIYKSYDKGKYSINSVNNTPVSSTDFTDNIDPAKIVYYTVRTALNNNARDESPASNEIEIDPADFKPSKPSGLKAVKSEDKIILLWKENPETWVAKYNIYKKTKENGQFKLIGESLTPVFTDKEQTGTKQFYRITASGTVKESDPSETVIVEF